MKRDEEIRADILEELHWDPKLDNSDIEVAVLYGIAILSGQVDSFSKMLEAEEAAKRVKHVKGIVEKISVKLKNTDKRTDEELSRAANDSLKTNNDIPVNDISVDVANGWVTIEGKLEWQFQREAITNALKDITGVKGLTNKVIIRPPHKSRLITDTIKRAMGRNANIDTDRIMIETAGDRVIIRGKVRSWNEKTEIEREAWFAPGVSDVEDYLVVG